MKTPTVIARIAEDVASAATEVSAAENRSLADQLSHWARLGMQMERAATVDHRRIRAVVSGEAQFADLTDAESQIAHAAVDTAIADRVADTAFGSTARSEGLSTVAVDADGAIVRTEPDGTTVVLVAADR